jgi:hypothetical protein
MGGEAVRLYSSFYRRPYERGRGKKTLQQTLNVCYLPPVRIAWLSANRCSAPLDEGNCPRLFAVRASLGLTYRDHLADPIDGCPGIEHRDESQRHSPSLFWLLLTAREANALA